MNKIILTIALVSLAAFGCNTQSVENTNNTNSEPARIPIPQSKLEIKVDGTSDVINETYIERVRVGDDPQGSVLRVKLNPEGTQILTKMTTENKGKQIAIRIDGELISSPTVDKPITEGAFIISNGKFTHDEAFKLKEKLQGYQEVPASSSNK